MKKLLETDNIYIKSQKTLSTPYDLITKLPVNDQQKSLVIKSRETIKNILDKKDPRLFIVIGPCSIHDPDAALAYAEKLKALAEKVKDSLYIIMRVYFEKPRTTVGWKGFINDPHMDDSFDIESGLYQSRKLLLDILSIGLPTATEALDPISPQYLQDLISWSAIGARTTESQTHREMASGLSSPVGFKNGTDGSISVAINAMQAANNPHRFLGINKSGQVAITTTSGNPYSHIVLRGGLLGPNYDSVNIKLAESELTKANINHAIMIDCSHANSNKNPELQPLVVDDIAAQILNGNQSILGLMIESHLFSGSQTFNGQKESLHYGISITDGCLDFEMTEITINKLATTIGEKLKSR